MIDFYTKNSYDINKVKCLMSDIFDLSKENILACYLDESGELLVNDSIECLCVVLNVDGDAKNLLQVYRIKTDINVLSNRLKSIAIIYHDTFFVSCDNFNGYYKISENSEIQKVFLNEDCSNDDKVVFLD